MKEQYLAVDLGSSNAKILLAAMNSKKKLNIKEVGRFSTPRVWINGHICINMYGIYQEVCNTISNLGKQGIPIKSIGVDSWASDFGIVDAYGLMKGLPVFYRDKRTNGMIDEVERLISYEKLYELTTQRRTQDTTLCQMLALQKEQPEWLQGNDQMMHIGDLLMYFFSGKVCSEISVASYSQMFNMRKKQWEEEVFELFRLPKSIQPLIVESGTCLGQITQEQALRCGSNRFEVIAPPVHDTASAGVAVPADDTKKWAFIATGSWFLVSMELDEPADNQLSYRYNLSNTGLAFGKTLIKRNICALWLIQECRKQWEQGGRKVEYAEIVARAEAAIPFYSVIDTEDISFYNPDNMVESVIRYLKNTDQRVPDASDIGQIARIIYESIALKCRYSLEVLLRTTKRNVESVYVVGGASQVGFLNRMLASALNREIISGPKEASAVGNILMQAVGSEELQNEQEVREVVRNSFVPKIFMPEQAEEWEAKYREFCSFCNLDL